MKDRATRGRGRGAVQFYSHLPGIRHSPSRDSRPSRLLGHAQTRAHYFRISSFFCSLLPRFLSPPMKCLLRSVGLASCLFFFSSPVGFGTEPRAHTWRLPFLFSSHPEASVHFKRFVNPSLSLFLPSEDDGRRRTPPRLARPLIFLSTPLPVPAPIARMRMRGWKRQRRHARGASGATCDDEGDSSSKYIVANSVFSVTEQKFVRNFVDNVQVSISLEICSIFWSPILTPLSIGALS